MRERAVYYKVRAARASVRVRVCVKSRFGRIAGRLPSAVPDRLLLSVLSAAIV